LFPLPKIKAKRPNPKSNSLKEIPSVQDILLSLSPKKLKIDDEYLKVLVQKVIQDFREKILSGAVSENLSKQQITDEILEKTIEEVGRLWSHRLKRVINATGIVLHTNLGRAPIAPEATKHLTEILENYCNLEIDLVSGKRGDRINIVEEIICLITGAEGAVVVNNNAGAVLLTLYSLCYKKEVPVSRGELVEIGGSFRMPEVMKAGGVKMIEVGTTNKTHLKDYTDKINPKTGGILKVHTSNYKIMGFTSSVPIEELIQLAGENQIPLIYDMGSGVIEDLRKWGYSREPVAREYIKAGVDIVTFSADKVLGGPQAGIIIGKKKYIEKIKKNHLLRALRCDKVTYALLDGTLRLYLQPNELNKSLPLAQMLNISIDELRKRGNQLISRVSNSKLTFKLVDTYSQMGSGALPLEKIPSVAVAVRSNKFTVTQIAKKMRLGTPPVIGYIENEWFMLNLRTVRIDEIPIIVSALKAL
jgi:L-seryl-tRNA(Ser) seleniumtransferase